MDKSKREEWETHIHFLSFDALHDLFCEFLCCHKESQNGGIVRDFLNSKKSDMDMLAIWIGHMRGSMYGNFSLRRDGKIVEFGPGFHLRRELFDFYLGLPLGWNKIIDSEIFFGENNAECGVNLLDGEFIKDATPIERISSRVLKKNME